MRQKNSLIFVIYFTPKKSQNREINMTQIFEKYKEIYLINNTPTREKNRKTKHTRKPILYLWQMLIDASIEIQNIRFSNTNIIYWLRNKTFKNSSAKFTPIFEKHI